MKAEIQSGGCRRAMLGLWRVRQLSHLRHLFTPGAGDGFLVGASAGSRTPATNRQLGLAYREAHGVGHGHAVHEVCWVGQQGDEAVLAGRDRVEHELRLARAEVYDAGEALRYGRTRCRGVGIEEQVVVCRAGPLLRCWGDGDAAGRQSHPYRRPFKDRA